MLGGMYVAPIRYLLVLSLVFGVYSSILVIAMDQEDRENWYLNFSGIR